MSGSPSEVVHLDEPWLSIVWDEAHQCVYAKFKAFASSVDFRKGTTKILLVVKERNASRLISDNRLLEGVSEVDQLWLRDSWIPMAVGAGLERIAVVVPPSGLGRIASEEIINDSVGKVFYTHTFESLPDAVAWLA